MWEAQVLSDFRILFLYFPLYLFHFHCCLMVLLRVLKLLNLSVFEKIGFRDKECFYVKILFYQWIFSPQNKFLTCRFHSPTNSLFHFKNTLKCTLKYT